jgi:hypothetical protein
MTGWRKSSHSGTHDESTCVEVATLPGRVVGLRDSTNPDGPQLHLTPTQWTSLLTVIRADTAPTRP